MKNIISSHSLTRSVPFCLILTICLLLFSCGDASKRPWTAHAIHTSGEETHEIRTIELADLNQDGRQELLVSREGSDVISIYASQPSSEGVIRWTETRIPAVAGIQHFHIWKTRPRDASEHFLIAAAGSPSMQVIQFAIPSAEAVFEPAAWAYTELPIPAGDWTAMHSNDFNNDGISDLALAGRSGDPNTSRAPEVIWMSNAQTGERSVVAIGASAAPILLFSEDIEGDGDTDIVVVDAAPGASSMGAYWLENPWPENPEVQWKRNFITLSSLQPTGGRMLDFDDDGKMDLVVCMLAANGSNRLVTFKKITAATEVAWLPIPLPISGRQGKLVTAAKADWDQDGFSDLALGFRDASKPLEHLLWLRNPGADASAPIWARKTLSGKEGAGAAAVIPYDVDADGDIDLISVGTGGMLHWYENELPSENLSQ